MSCLDPFAEDSYAETSFPSTQDFFPKNTPSYKAGFPPRAQTSEHSLNLQVAPRPAPERIRRRSSHTPYLFILSLFHIGCFAVRSSGTDDPTRDHF